MAKSSWIKRYRVPKSAQLHCFQRKPHGYSLELLQITLVPQRLKIFQCKCCLVFDTLPLWYMHFGTKVHRNWNHLVGHLIRISRVLIRVLSALGFMCHSNSPSLVSYEHLHKFWDNTQVVITHAHIPLSLGYVLYPRVKDHFKPSQHTCFELLA
jgi:hypothetical protein